MLPVELAIRRHNFFLRRRDLLAMGYTDAQLGRSLARKRIFRVRQGWYSVPDAPEAGIRTVRVGGRLTALAARRRAHPYRARPQRKRRRSAAKLPP